MSRERRGGPGLGAGAGEAIHDLMPSYTGASASFGARYIHGPMTDFHPLADAIPGIHLMDFVEQALLSLSTLHEKEEEDNVMFYNAILELIQHVHQFQITKFSGLMEHEATGKMLRKINKYRAGHVEELQNPDLLALLQKHYSPESKSYHGFFACEDQLKHIEAKWNATISVISALKATLNSDLVQQHIAAAKEENRLELDKSQKAYFDETKAILMGGMDEYYSLDAIDLFKEHVTDLQQKFNDNLIFSVRLFRRRRDIYGNIHENYIKNSRHYSRVKTIAQPTSLSKNRSFEGFIVQNAPPPSDQTFSTSILSRQFVLELLGIRDAAVNDKYDTYMLETTRFDTRPITTGEEVVTPDEVVLEDKKKKLGKI